jgi:hypothetical protein
VDLSSWFVVAVIVAGFGVAIARLVRDQHRLRLRAEWGQPRPKPRRMDAIVASHESRASAPGAPPALDDRTWADLNLDDVFIGLDRTESTLGQHALYHRLRTAPVAEPLDAFEALVTRFGDHAPLRERAQLALGRLQDPHGYDLWWMAQPDAVETPGWYIIFPVLTAATLVLAVLTPFRHALLPTLLTVLAINFATHLLTFQRVGAIATAFRQLAPIVATGQALRFLEGDDVDPIVGPLRRDTPGLVRLKTISRWVSGDPLMLSVSAGPLLGMVTELINTIWEYLTAALPIDAAGVFVGAADLRARSQALLRVVAAIGDVDAAVSVASWRAGRDDWTRPVFRPAGAVATLSDLRHPLVEHAVPNSIELRPARGVLVTGSNMSGKSTFLRTAGVSAVLAQTVHTCLAAVYEAPVFRVRSSIGRADDLIAGKSYYIVEVEALLSLVRASADGAPHLFLLDELFRGTNAVERIAAGASVLRELLHGPDGPTSHVVLTATHDGELVDLLADLYEAYHFGDALSDEGLTFDHRLKAGRSTSRNAIALLKLHGAPPDLIARALREAEILDAQRRLSS